VLRKFLKQIWTERTKIKQESLFFFKRQKRVGQFNMWSPGSKKSSALCVAYQIVTQVSKNAKFMSVLL
jgi:hypothetical protein